jgi:hypothetical protein
MPAPGAPQACSQRAFESVLDATNVRPAGEVAAGIPSAGRGSLPLMAADTTPAPRVTVRLTAERAAELEDLARRSERTVAGEVRFALERHLATQRERRPQ